MDRAREFLQSLKNLAPSGAVGPRSTDIGGSCSEMDWKREYEKLRNEVEIYKRWVQSETEAELGGMEVRWSQLQNEAELMKRNLEGENRDLSRQNTSLQRQVTALRDELEETRVMSHEQVQHCTTMKRQLQMRCTDLELKVEEKEKAISELTLQYTESKSRNERMYRELLDLAEQNEQLICHSNQTRLSYNANLDEFAVECNRMLDKVASYYKDEIQTVVSNYVGVSEELAKSKDLVSGMLSAMKSKEEEFQNTATRERNMVSDKIKEAVDSLQDLAKDRDSAMQDKEDAQELLLDVMKAVSGLSEKIIKHQRETLTLCRNTLSILGENEKDSMYLFDDANESDFGFGSKGIDSRNAQGAASELAATMDREEFRLKSFIKAVLDWKKRSEERIVQFQGRIDDLEKSASAEMAKHTEEINNVLEKSKKYKKLVVKLREKLLVEPISPFLEKQGQVCAPERKSDEPRRAHAVAGHLDLREAVGESFEKSRKKPSSSSSASMSCRGNLKSTHLNSFEYKRILDNADCVRKCIDQGPRFPKSRNERRSYQTVNPARGRRSK